MTEQNAKQEWNRLRWKHGRQGDPDQTIRIVFAHLRERGPEKNVIQIHLRAAHAKADQVKVGAVMQNYGRFAVTPPPKIFSLHEAGTLLDRAQAQLPQRIEASHKGLKDLERWIHREHEKMHRARLAIQSIPAQPLQEGGKS